MRKNRKVGLFGWIFLFLLFAALFSCGGDKIEVQYKKAEFHILSVSHISKNILSVYFAEKARNSIFVTEKKVWKIDLENNTEDIYIRRGVGPDEILNPRQLVLFNDNIWINMGHPDRHIFRFPAAASDLKLEILNFRAAFMFDDFQPLQDNKVVMVYPYWKDELVRIYDLDTQEIKTGGKPYFVEAMKHFNINSASVAVLKDKAYVIQSIKPEVQVFSLPSLEKVGIIELNPPFFREMPPKYEVDKFDKGGHFKWMSGWTLLSEIMADGNRLLIKYRKGYEQLYYYELIDLDSLDRRSFIDETVDSVFHFKVRDKVIDIEMYEQQEEQIVWKKAEVSF